MVPHQVGPTVKILGLGCGGMLGAAVYDVFKDIAQFHATDIVVTEPWLAKLDIRNEVALSREFKRFKPDYVLNLAAMTDLEECERRPGDAYETNMKSAATVARLCAECGAVPVFISSAGVFDGTQTIYRDDDVPNPLNIYAKSKYDAEIFIQSNVERYLIFRAGWMMGGGPTKDKKFVGNITRQLRAGQREIFAVNDLRGTPTYTLDFAKTMRRVLDSGNFGLYHMVNGGTANRFDVAREIVEHLQLTSAITLTPVTSEHFSDEFFARRPRSEQLVNAKLDRLGLNTMRDWRAALKDYLDRYDWDLPAI